MLRQADGWSLLSRPFCKGLVLDVMCYYILRASMLGGVPFFVWSCEVFVLLFPCNDTPCA